MSTTAGLKPIAPLHLLLLLFIIVVWGFNFVVSKIGVDLVPPFTLATLRFGLVTLLLLPWLKWIPGQMKRLLGVSALIGGFHFGALFYGLSLASNVGPVAISVQLNVPFMVILAALFLGEKVGAWRISGIALGFAGVMFMGFDPIVFVDLDALFFVMSAGLAYGLGFVMMRGMKETHPMTLQAWTGLASFPILLVLALLFEQDHLAAVQNGGWTAMAIIVYSAVAASIIGHGGMFYLVKRYEVSQLVPFQLAPPVLGVVAGVLVLNDEISWRIVVGGLMVLTGVAIIQAREAIKARRDRLNEPAL